MAKVKKSVEITSHLLFIAVTHFAQTLLIFNYIYYCLHFFLCFVAENLKPFVIYESYYVLGDLMARGIKIHTFRITLRYPGLNTD